MYTSYNQVPFYRKNWYAILTFFLFTPLFLLSVFTGPIYYQRGGALRHYGNGVRWFFGIFVLLALAAAIFAPPINSQQSAPSSPAAAVSDATPQESANDPTKNPVFRKEMAEETGIDPVTNQAVNVTNADPSTEQGAVHTYGPAIKALQLGADYQTTSKALLDLQSNLGANYTLGEPSNDNALFMPNISGGSWEIITADGVNVPLVLAHFNGNKVLDFYELRDGASNTLFSASGMSDEEFADAIAKNYNIELDMQIPSGGQVSTHAQQDSVIAASLGIPSSSAIHYTYEEHNWRIEVTGKDIKVTAVQPQEQRFN